MKKQLGDKLASYSVKERRNKKYRKFIPSSILLFIYHTFSLYLVARAMARVEPVEQ